MKKITAIFSVFLIFWCAPLLRGGKVVEKFDTKGFGELPVLSNGRIKPMDTVARTTLLMLHGNSSIKDAEGRVLSPTEWLMETLMKPGAADKMKVFRIDNPDVLGLFDWNQSKGKYFSFDELRPFLEEIERQTTTAEEVKPSLRGFFQNDIIKLRDRIVLYNQVKNSFHNDDQVNFEEEINAFQKAIQIGRNAFRLRSAGEEFKKEDLEVLGQFYERYQFIAKIASLRPVPREQQQDWQSVGDSLIESVKTGKIDPAVTAYASMTSAYNADKSSVFNSEVKAYRSYLEKNYPRFLKKTDYEYFFNQLEPFYRCMILYVMVFLLALISWLVWQRPLSNVAFWLLIATFLLHSLGLVSRMWLQGRPPVTNLYSSAIFVGWGACLLCIILEKIHRNGIGSLTAAVIGFSTLLIAHHLSFEGDTMEMMRAVLDTNFWLATHVVAVTMGYSATFLAGFLALVYVARGLFTTSLDRATAKSLYNMVYGIVCFATLFSFVGTILGGIWADQSWGRFWGFDPKENGALLIVIWNAIILHARWGGYIRERGLMNLAMFGNIVTSFSWFGVNMLGAGLHSYGFMSQAYRWLILFDVLQLLLIGAGMIPLKYWGSFMDTRETADRKESAV